MYCSFHNLGGFTPLNAYVFHISFDVEFTITGYWHLQDQFVYVNCGCERLNDFLWPAHLSFPDYSSVFFSSSRLLKETRSNVSGFTNKDTAGIFFFFFCKNDLVICCKFAIEHNTCHRWSETKKNSSVFQICMHLFCFSSCLYLKCKAKTTSKLTSATGHKNWIVATKNRDVWLHQMRMREKKKESKE